VDSGTLQLNTVVEHRSLRLTHFVDDAHCQLSYNAVASLSVVPMFNSVVSDSGPWDLHSTLAVHVCTHQGKRLLRSALLQPLINVPTILERQKAIGTLRSNPHLQRAAQTLLAGLPKDIHKCVPPGSSVAGQPLSKMPKNAAFTAVQAVLHLRHVLVASQVCIPFSRCR
jgi:DNA mismatch repair ATPase MutS